jgi:hypothetical protein
VIPLSRPAACSLPSPLRFIWCSKGRAKSCDRLAGRRPRDLPSRTDRIRIPPVSFSPAAPADYGIDRATDQATPARRRSDLTLAAARMSALDAAGAARRRREIVGTGLTVHPVLRPPKPTLALCSRVGAGRDRKERAQVDPTSLFCDGAVDSYRCRDLARSSRPSVCK